LKAADPGRSGGRFDRHRGMSDATAAQIAAQVPSDNRVNTIKEASGLNRPPGSCAEPSAGNGRRSTPAGSSEAGLLFTGSSRCSAERASQIRRSAP
jgi:hypothetical protein